AVALASETGEVRISGATADPSNSATIRVNRWNPQQLLAAAGSFPSGQPVTRLFYSGDGGATWGASFTPQVSQFEFESTVDWTSDGTAWMISAGLHAPDYATATLQAYRSTDGGVSFWYDASISSTLADLDLDQMWVDHGATSPFKDTVYVTWHQGPATIVRRRRVGPASSWQPAVQVSGAETTGSPLCGDVKTNAAGDVFVFYHDTGSQGIYVAKSTDGGASFGAPGKLAVSVAAFHFFVPANTSSGILVCPTAGAYRSSTVNNVYVAWNDLSGDPGCTHGAGPGANVSSTCKSRIFFSRSNDGGATWSPPAKVNDTAGLNDQFLPAMVVDEPAATSR
ncbi:MAG: glycoside hydrolase, partial [Acidobacteriota bacterium]|nr:glycoside hydrolase [Acidobacteriota bacterium]